jgi:hypothetical protein
MQQAALQHATSSPHPLSLPRLHFDLERPAVQSHANGTCQAGYSGQGYSGYQGQGCSASGYSTRLDQVLGPVADRHVVLAVDRCHVARHQPAVVELVRAAPCTVQHATARLQNATCSEHDGTCNMKHASVPCKCSMQQDIRAWEPGHRSVEAAVLTFRGWHVCARCHRNKKNLHAFFFCSGSELVSLCDRKLLLVACRPC